MVAARTPDTVATPRTLNGPCCASASVRRVRVGSCRLFQEATRVPQAPTAAPSHWVSLRRLDHGGGDRSSTLGVAARSSATAVESASYRRGENQDVVAVKLRWSAAPPASVRKCPSCPCGSGKVQGQMVCRTSQEPVW